MLYSLGLGPSAKVGSSAKFGVGIQGIYSQFTGGPLAKVGLSAKFGVLQYSRHLFLIHWGVHLPK